MEELQEQARWEAQRRRPGRRGTGRGAGRRAAAGSHWSCWSLRSYREERLQVQRVEVGAPRRRWRKTIGATRGAESCTMQRLLDADLLPAPCSGYRKRKTAVSQYTKSS